jgi:ABC-type transport system involved in multi-copper enzyme maturation permease subunit
MSPRLVLVIAGLTLREIARRRILWVLLGLSVASVVLVGWGVDRLVALAREQGARELEIRIGVSQVLIMIAFMFSFVLAMSAAFLAAPAIASDVETGTVHAMLARPLRRAELVLGRWLGLSIVVAGYAITSGLLAIAAVGLVSGHVPPSPWIAVGYLAFQSVAVLTLALALGTRLPSIAAGAVTVVLFGLGWFAGVLANVAIAFDATPLAGLGDVVRVLIPTDGLWRGVIYGLEPPVVLLMSAGRNTEAMRANPFFADAPPPLAFTAWAVAWVALVLLAGMALFRRREL